MNKTFKRVLLLTAVVCMFCAVFAIAGVAATTSPCVHNYVEETEKDLTGLNDCNGVGVYWTYCTKCGDRQLAQRAGHVYGKTVTTMAATCTTPEMKVRVCTKCEEAYRIVWKDTTTVPAGHVLDDNGVSVAATCTTPAGVKLGCKECDYFEIIPYTGDKAVAALGHLTYTEDPAVDATCVTPGRTAKIMCQREDCPIEDKVVVASVEIPVNPNAHKLKLELTFPMSCKTQQNGVGHYECQNVNEEENVKCTFGKGADNIVIPWQHDYTSDKAKVLYTEPAVLCKVDGWKQVKCANCDSVATLVVEKAAHAFNDTSKPATCTTPEMSGKYCEICGLLNGEEEVKAGGQPALGHNLKNSYVNYVPNCEEPSGLVMKCTRCDYAEYHDSDNVKTEPALGHDPVPVEDVPATCTTPGHAGKVVCGRPGCGKIIDEGKKTPVDVTAHKWILDITANNIPADCKTGESGFGKYVCENKNSKNEACTAYKFEEIKAEHKFVKGTQSFKWYKEPTCTEEGLAYAWCEKCITYYDDAVFPKLGHNIVTGELAADCVNAKRTGEYCTRCDYEVTTVVVGPLAEAAKGHTYLASDDVYIKAANCLYPAGVVRNCSKCDHEEIIAKEGSVALGHLEVSGIKNKPATCEEKGWEGQIVCGREGCGEEIKAGKVIPVDTVNGHKAGVPADDYIIEDADCKTMTPGIAYLHCMYCGKDMGVGKFEAVHSYDPANAETIKEATCVAKGKIKYTCDKCNGTITEDTDKLPGDVGGLSAHTAWIQATATNPYYFACGEVGYGLGTNNGWFCPVCNFAADKLVVVNEKVRAHSYKFTDIDGDCKYTAGTLITCKHENCKYEEFIADDPDAVAGHTPVEADDLAPTCKTRGWTDKIVCSKCKGEDGKPTVLSITWLEPVPGAHEADFENFTWVDGQKADCMLKKDGIAQIVCKHCREHMSFETLSYEIYGHEEVQDKKLSKNATCKEDGRLVEYCKNCQLTVTDKVLPASEVAHKIVKDHVLYADCENPMRVVDYCSVCGMIEKETVVPGTEKKGHEYNPTIVPADCENPVRIKYTCSNVGCPAPVYYDTKNVPESLAEEALGHKIKSGDCEPTCTSKGYTGRVLCERENCPKNGVIAAGVELPVDPTNHNLVPVNANELGLTCYKPLKTNLKCSNKGCNYVTVGEYTKDHNWDAAQPKVDADYTYIYKKCPDCPATKIIEWLIPHCDHEEKPVVVENKVEPTCTEAGSYEEVIYCNLCKEELSRVEKAIEALGHTEEDLVAVEPTCTETGLKAGKKCTVCGVVTVEQEEIAALGHTEEDLAAVEATCTEAGKTAGKKCTVCGVETVEQKVVDALGHKEEEIPAVAADCTVDGLTAGKKCTVCGVETVKQEVVKAEGHKVEVVAGKAATCTEAGLTDGEKCSVCGEELKAQVEIPALGHTVVVTEGTPATCDKPGMTAGKSCSVCGEAIEGATEIPALGHKYTVTWDFNADFTKKIKISTCDVCGTVVTSEPMDF